MNRPQQGNAKKVKLTFAHGAKLADPDKLFNAGDASAIARHDHQANP